MKTRIATLLFCLPLLATAAYGEMGPNEGTDYGPRPVSQQQTGGAPQASGDVRGLLTFEKELELTTDQVNAIRQVRTDSMRLAQQKMAEAQARRSELSELLGQDRPDFGAIRAKVKEVTELRIAAENANIDALEKGYTVLTDVQKDKLAAIKKVNREKMAFKRQPAAGNRPDDLPGTPRAGSGFSDHMPGNRSLGPIE